MAHPSKNIPKNTYYIDSTNELAAPENRHFFSIVAVVGGTVTVNGGGVYEYLASGAGDGTHIDTDGTTLGSGHAAGYYEALPTTDVDISLAAGQTIFGRFTSITAGASVKVIAYS